MSDTGLMADGTTRVAMGGSADERSAVMGGTKLVAMG